MKHRRFFLYWLVGAILFIGAMPRSTLAQQKTVRRPAEVTTPAPTIDYEEDTGNLTVASELLRTDYQVWRVSKPDKKRYLLTLLRQQAEGTSCSDWLVYLGPGDKLKPLKLLAEKCLEDDGTALFPTPQGKLSYPAHSRQTPATFNGTPLLEPILEYGIGIPLRKGELCPTGPDSCKHPDLKRP